MKYFSDLLAVHGELDQVFLEHQVALLHLDFATASRYLDRYESGLLAHMKDEEEILIPIYKERAHVIKGGDVGLFLGEHEKMRMWVQFFKEQVARLSGVSTPETDLILLLDRQAFYKRLSGHHDKREKEILYPELDRITSEKEKLDLLGSVTRTLSITNARAVRGETA